MTDELRARATPEEIARVRKEYSGPYYINDDDIQIDDDAQCSVTDNGVWVQAWLWLQNNDQED